jgi:hypothetical protein
MRLLGFETMMLRRMFEPKRREQRRSCRKLYIEELHNSYCPPNIIRMIKPRRMKWAYHVAHMEETEMYT